MLASLDRDEAAIHLDDLEALHRPVLADEADRVDAEDPLTALLVRAGGAVDQRPGRPRGRGRPRLRRLRHDLELGDAGRALAVGGAEAVRARVAAADDDDVFALGRDRRALQVAFLHAVGRYEVVHGEVDAGQVATLDRQVAAERGTAGQEHRVVRRAELLDGDVDADVDPGREGRALGPHLVQAPLEDALFHLELRDAVAQQPADPVGPLQHRHVVAGSGELLRGGEPRRAGTHDGDPAAGPLARRLWGDPTLLPGTVDDLDLHLLDGDRVSVDAQHASRLARRRAEPTGELREVVGGVQPLDRLAPVSPVDQVVPLRDEIAEWATVVAKGDAAVHASRGLGLRGLLREVLIDLLPVADAHVDRPSGRKRAVDLQKTLGVGHLGQLLVAAMTASSTSTSSRRACSMASSTFL